MTEEKEECVHPWEYVDITVDVYGEHYSGVSAWCSKCLSDLDINKKVGISNSE